MAVFKYMDLRQIQYFICLYEEQSVTKAAQRLNIVQPALSMQIAKLESEVGRNLFDRTTRGMRPTPKADEMYSLFLPVVTAFSRARSKVTHDGIGLSGYVRLGLVASLGYNILPSALLQFVEQHPNVSLSITDGLTDHLCERVAAGELEFAIVNRPRMQSGLTYETIVSEEIVLVSSLRGGVRLPPEVELKDLMDHKLILPTRDHGLRAMIEEGAKLAGISLIPTLELDSIMSQAILVNQGSYLSFFPRSIVENLKNRSAIRLRTHTIQSPELSRDIAYVYNPKNVPSRAAQIFAQTLIGSIQDSNSMVSPRDLFLDSL
jgi:LysR family transcriptional regulator, nitrogen assimilation regulatory protein